MSMRFITDQWIRCRALAFASLASLVMATTGCLEERTVDVVLTGDYAVDLHHDSGDVAIPTVVGVPDIVVDLLADEGYTLDDVKSIDLAGAAYGALMLDGDHDWIISGEIDVQRVDGVVAGPSEPLLDYIEVSIEESLGRSTPAPLRAEGVAVVNRAMNDYVAGGNPMLEFRIRNQESSPSPSLIDPLVFDWRLWLSVRVVIVVKTEVPDPF